MPYARGVAPPPRTTHLPGTLVAIATDAMSSALRARAVTDLERQQGVSAVTISSGTPTLVRLALAGSPTSVRLRRLGAKVANARAARRERRVGVGAAGTTGEADARALAALDLGSSLPSVPEVVLYTDVVPLELILSSGGVPALGTIIAPIVAHDARYGTRLRETIECLYATGCSLAATGRVLHLHRHTVATRLAAAERLLGLPLRGEPGRLTLELALAAHRLAQRDASSP